jgi:hypothetical protein
MLTLPEIVPGLGSAGIISLIRIEHAFQYRKVAWIPFSWTPVAKSACKPPLKVNQREELLNR